MPADFSGRCTTFLRDCARASGAIHAFDARGKLTRVAGLVMEATGLKLPLGTVCVVEQRDGGSVEAEVVGFSGERLFLMPVSDLAGVSPGATVRPSDPVFPRPRLGVPWHPRRRSSDLAKHLPVGDALLGRVVDGAGRALDRVRRFKQLYSRYRRNRDLVNVGAYVKGSDPLLDQAIVLQPRMASFLQQDPYERATRAEGAHRLAELTDLPGAA